MSTDSIVINVNEVFHINSIASKDTEIWQNICKKIKSFKNINKPIILDFKGLLIKDAWKNQYFLNLLKDTNVTLRVYYNSEITKDVNIICKLCNYGSNRIINVGEITVIKEKPKELVKRRIIDKLKDNIHITNNTLILNYADALNSLEKTEVILAIKIAIDEILEEIKVPITHIIIDFKSVVIVATLLDTLLETFKDYYLKYQMEFKTNIYEKDLKLHLLKYKGQNVALKQKIINTELPINAPVILIKFLESKTTTSALIFDDSNIDWCHIAIFKGFDGQNLIFDHYPVRTFHTKETIKQEKLKQNLKKETISVPLADFGFWDAFLGAKYHVNYIIQFNKSSTTEEWINTEDELKQEKLTMPELAKIVFDENNIKYNKELLEDSIKKTKEILMESNN